MKRRYDHHALILVLFFVLHQFLLLNFHCVTSGWRALRHFIRQSFNYHEKTRITGQMDDGLQPFIGMTLFKKSPLQPQVFKKMRRHFSKVLINSFNEIDVTFWGNMPVLRCC